MSQPPPPLPSGWSQPSGSYVDRAGFGSRLGGLLIDGLVLLVPNLIVQSTSSLVASWIMGVAIRLAYEVYFIASPSGQTVGMRALGIRAIDAQTGGRVDYGRAFVRVLMSYVSGIPCALGYLWMLWDPERQTWHDKVAGTYVVPVANHPVDRWPG
jgi:uncharacterized RDD family membrane protein YckC